MPQVIRGPHLSVPRFAARGRTHGRADVLAATAFICGVVAFFAGFVVPLHFLASAVGVIGFAEGLYAQLVSDTTGERMFIVVGVIGAFVGMGLGFAHGGFTL
ncbi:MAG TPA: hypothetical protein VGL93_33390 [Streptosporangiaceae bacterium]|jgi:hypothetical protein